MFRRSLGYSLWAALSLVSLGCPLGDPVRTTVQQVRLRLVDSTSGQPIAGATIELKTDFDANYRVSPDPTPRGVNAEDHRQYLREFWAQRPWFSGVTGSDGEVFISVIYTVLDRSRGSEPPRSRDWVHGERYLVKAMKKGTQGGESPAVELSVMMQVGEFAKGSDVIVTVVEIQQPQYSNPK